MGREVLDLGCGAGHGMQILARSGAARVVGVEDDPGAVAAARSLLGAREKVIRTNFCELPLPNDSFDLAVCWDAIERLSEDDRALIELRRVLRPDGILLTSSPNPSIGERFSHIAVYRQRTWLASTVEAADDGGAAGLEPSPPTLLSDVFPVETSAPGGDPVDIVLAANCELPQPSSLVVLGDSFEARWWADQVAAGEAAADEARRELARTRSAATETEGRLHAAAAALLEANQALARVPLIESRVEELRGERTWLVEERSRFEADVARLEADVGRLSEESAALRARAELVEGSRSWRLLSPLRRLRNVLRRRGSRPS